MFEDTLIIWGGEFGRTVYSQGKLTDDNYGRDHHPRCFTVWLAGGGIRGGLTIGETDDFSYNITRDPVSVFDLNATILHCLGVDHTRLTHKFQGRYFRLTDVHGAVLKQALAGIRKLLRPNLDRVITQFLRRGDHACAASCTTDDSWVRANIASISELFNTSRILPDAKANG